MKPARFAPIPSLLALCLLASTGPGAAGAAPLHPGIALFGGFQQYGMRDANQTIALANDEYSRSIGTNGFVLPGIEQGFGFGAGLRFDVRKDVVVSLDVTRLAASTSEAWLGVGSAEWKLPGNAITATGTYFFPTDSKVRFGLGAGVGYYHCSGSIAAAMAGSQWSEDVSGNGIGFHGMGTLDAAVTSRAHVEVSLGLRYAKTSNIEANGQEMPKGDGGKLRADWSGAMTRAGVTYYFGNE